MADLTGCKAGGQQRTCPGPGFEAWREQGAEIWIWCVGQENGDNKCRLKHHLYCQDRP